MAYQPGANTVTLKGRWLIPDGTPASGYIELTLEDALGDPVSNTVYTKTKRRFNLDSNGEISTPYIVTGTINPVSGTLSGTKVKIREVLDDTSSNTWVTTFTAADITTGNIIWLSDLSPVEAKPLNQYVSIGSYSEAINDINTNKANRTQTGDSPLVGANANTLVRRDSLGRVQTAEPTELYHATTKNYTDSTFATKANAALTGSPTAPTQTAGDSSTKLATTAFVTTADNLKAPLASPTFTGTPSSPTAAAGTNTTQVATTAFVTTADNLKAPINNPTFTGTATTPNLVISTGTAPSTATSTGTKGQIAYASGFLYVCVATNTWQRVALATW